MGLALDPPQAVAPPSPHNVARHRCLDKVEICAAAVAEGPPARGSAKNYARVGSKGIPVPVSDKEIEKILGQIKDGVAQPKSGIEYSVGEKVQVVDGPFASFSGMVEDIDEEKSRLKVSVSIFGRPTPVDLEYNQVEKVS